MTIAVNEVDETTNGAPHPEAFPSHSGKIIHDISTAQDRERPHDINSRAAERPLRFRVFMPHHHNSY